MIMLPLPFGLDGGGYMPPQQITRKNTIENVVLNSKQSLNNLQNVLGLPLTQAPKKSAEKNILTDSAQPPTNIIDKVMISIKELLLEDPGGGGSYSSPTQTTSDNMLESTPYKLTNVTINSQLPHFNYGDTTGLKDMISHEFFGKIMENKYKSTYDRWYDDDPDGDWATHFITFEITNTKATGNEQKTDTFSLLYNSGRDYYHQNEDYTFVALQPADKDHIDPVGSKQMIRVFDKDFDFSSLNHNDSTGNTLITNYIYTGHDFDNGDDDEGGNILDGISYNSKSPFYSGVIKPNIEETEGDRSLSHIAKNMVLTIVNTLNGWYTYS